MELNEPTQRVVDLLAGDLSVYGRYLCDFSYPEDDFDRPIDGSESFTSSCPATGRALQRYVSDLRERHPAWAEVDLAGVDWPGVSEVMEQRLVLQLVGLSA